MSSKIIKTFLFSCAFIMKAQFFLHAQGTVFPGAFKEKRAALKKTLIENNIIKNLSLPLNRANEEAWQDAFNTINLTKYEPQFVKNKISEAVKYLPKAGREYKKELLQLINSDFPLTYHAQIFSLFKNTGDDHLLLAMAANYVLNKPIAAEIKFMQETVNKRLKGDPENAVLYELKEQLDMYAPQRAKPNTVIPELNTLFLKDFLPGEIVVYSIQRKNRNYPGIVIIRKADGSFVNAKDSGLFMISQLARSQGNMPGYISLGNTPQGIFRMDGFDTSKSYFIGPTTNIQLTMPFEYKASHFYRDSTISDTV